MTRSQQQTTARSAAPERLTIIAAVIRWQGGGKSGGPCADCGGYVLIGHPRALFTAHVTRPPDELVNASRAYPGTAAEARRVDAFLRETMARQARQRRGQPTPGGEISRPICWRCTSDRLDGFLRNQGGVFSRILAGLGPDSFWTALVMAGAAGYGQPLKHYTISGHGKVPPLAELLEEAQAAIRER